MYIRADKRVSAAEKKYMTGWTDKEMKNNTREDGYWHDGFCTGK